MPQAEIIVLSDLPEPENFPGEWYSLATPNNFWMMWRMRAFQKLLKRIGAPVQKPLLGLEIGCGNGVLRLQVEQATAWTVDGAEIDRKALEMNLPLRGDRYLYDVSSHHSKLRERYDFLILFDVIEHIPDVPAMLRHCLFHLKPGGLIFINVPALECMRSKYDDVAGHLRRYDKSSLTHVLQDQGLKTLDSGYWGASMLPLLSVRKVLLRSTPPEQVIKRGFSPPSKLADIFLKSLMRIETTLLPYSPLGTSLLAAARKPL